MKLENVFKKIEETEDNTIAKLQEIVRIPSISTENKGIECADIIINIIEKEIGFKTQKISTPGFPIIYAENMVGAENTLVFYDHYDVQPVDPLKEWISPPFEPEIRDGKLYGRGVQDNKGNLIARIFAIKAYQSIFNKLPINIKFVIEGQEEIGSPFLQEFIENYPDLVQGDFCIWESGHRDAKRRQQVWLGVKGILYLNLEVDTAKRDIHSSWGGVVVSSAWELIWALSSLKNEEQMILIEGFYDDVQPPTQEVLQHLESLPFDEEQYYDDFGIQKFIKTGLDLKKAYYHTPSLTINGLNSGYQGPGSKTIIPAKARAKIDFRLVPNQEPDDILKKLKKHLRVHHFENVKITSSHGYPPAMTPLTSKFLHIILEAGEKIYGQPLITHPTTGGSGPQYLFINKMDCISFGCGNSNSQIHAPNENILIEDLLLNMKHLAAIFAEFEKI
ncbi:MAG: M20/M25/M40 family metallo-hydrolase [Promethearchaeota archaeon]